MTPRPRCLRCRRPAALCYCRALVPVATRTRVVFLQHPRERTMAIGTARMAHLGLANSELHVGVRFDGHARLRALLADPTARVALLHPDPTPGATGAAVADPPRTLVVLDGTWTTARKMLARNPALERLPRLSLRPAAPSAYRIRREPAPHCLSTVEAVAQALAGLEGDGGRFRPLLAAFHALVATQVHYATAHRAPHRHDRKRARRRPSVIEGLLRERFADLVLVQAEANPRDGLPHELVQLVGLRPATGAVFAAVVAPRGTLGPRAAARLELDSAALARAIGRADAVAAWTAFVRPADVLAGWGRFTPGLLAAEGVALLPWLDLRAEVCRRLGRSPGGVEAAVAMQCLPRPPRPIGPGRAGRTVAALAALTGALGGRTDGVPAGAGFAAVRRVHRGHGRICLADPLLP